MVFRAFASSRHSIILLRRCLCCFLACQENLPGAASVQKRLLRQRVNCCVTRAQAGVLLSRLKFALPGWAQAEGRRAAERARFAQRAEQARAYSGEGRHSEEWGWSFGRPAH